MQTNGEQHAETLHNLARSITQAGLRQPVTIMLGILKPVDFLSTQAALFVHPFIRGHAWERYTHALMAEAAWEELRNLLAE